MSPCTRTPPDATIGAHATEWRLQCTYIALAASTLFLVPALALLVRGRPWLALLLVFASLSASLMGWLVPVFAAALG